MDLKQIVELTDRLAALVCGEDVEVKVTHPGALKLGDQDFLSTGPEHFIKLAKSTTKKEGRSGRQQVTNELLNLERFNKVKEPKTAAHARKMIDALEAHFKKEASEGY